MSYVRARTVNLVALTPNANGPVTLTTAEDGIHSIDVADSVILGGRVRLAHPPTFPGPRVIVAVLMTAVVLVVVGPRVRRMLRRHGQLMREQRWPPQGYPGWR